MSRFQLWSGLIVGITLIVGLCSFTLSTIMGLHLSWPDIIAIASLSGISGACLIQLILHRIIFTSLQQIATHLGQMMDDPELISAPIPRHQMREISALHHQIETVFVTMRKSLRQQQRLADIGQAVAKINHDVRNSLTVATLLADQLEDSTDPEIAKAGPLIVQSTKMAAEMCQNMLDYLAELPPPDYQMLTMQEIISHAQDSYPIKIDYQGPDSLFMDRLFLTRILSNLARNASLAQATTLQIDIWTAGHLQIIDFSDDGPGIPDARKSELFAPFAASSRAGSGLGLAICLDLAIALGGKFFLSRSTSAGTEFRLQLPRHHSSYH